MALQSSGTISLSEMDTEFGAYTLGTGDNSISEYYSAGSLPASGTISASDFFSQAITMDEVNVNVGSLTDADALSI